MSLPDPITVPVDWNKRVAAYLKGLEENKAPEDVKVVEIEETITDLSLLGRYPNIEELTIHQPEAEMLRLNSIDALPPLKRLRHLELLDHLLADLPDDFAARYPALETVSLVNNKFYTPETLDPLRPLQHLRRLDLEHNPLVKRCAKEDPPVRYRDVLFATMPGLTMIDGQDKDGNQVDADEDSSADTSQDSQLISSESDVGSGEEEEEAEEQEDSEGGQPGQEGNCKKRGADDDAAAANGAPEAKRARTEEA